MDMHNNNQIYDWNPDRVERLEALHRNGLSFTLIAADIGVSRAAAIGKAHRLHLPKRNAVAQYMAHAAAARSPPRSRRRRELAAKPVVTPPPVIIPNHDYSCTIIELTDTTCRYPLWGVGDQHHQRRYCGRPGASVSAGVPYCRRHTKIAWPSTIS